MLAQASVIDTWNHDATAVLMAFFAHLADNQTVAIKHLIVALELHHIRFFFYQTHLNKSRENNSINKVHGERSQLDNIVGAIKRKNSKSFA